MKSITILKSKIITHSISSGGDGAEAIYALRDRDTLARMMLEEIAKTGQNIRKWYQQRLPSDTSKDYYFIHRNTGVTEPVLVEYGFVDNAADASFIKSHWKEMVDAVVRAVALYKGIPYTIPAEKGTYTVISGDTLWSIAKKFNIGIDELKSLNNLTANTISVGQVLKIPGYVPPSLSQTTYVVQKGDSLWSIASAYNTTPADIMKLNNLTSTNLSIGQELKIPTPAPTPIPPTPTPPPTPTGNTYTVQSGDSLWSIANKFGVSVTELRNLNNLTSDILSIGQVLLIPIQPSEAPSGATIYTVKSGDNLYSIASKFGVTVDAIKDTNKLKTNTLSIGQTLIIPLPGSTPPPVTTAPPVTTTPTKTYTVKSGDNLYSIANRFGVTADVIKRANNLTSNLLSIGQVLTIPTSGSTTPSTKTYTVKSGDNLYSIANRFGVTADAIKRANNLKTNLLSIGQVLIIP